MESREGKLFVSMPRYESTKDEEYKNICNPITKEFREDLYDTILDTFDCLEPGREDKDGLDFNVKVNPFKREGSNLRGLCRIYIEDSFVVSNVSILAGRNGDFVAMPSYKIKQMDENGKSQYQDIAYPVTKEFREKLCGTIMDAYKQARDGNRAGKSPATEQAAGGQALDLPIR